MDEQTQAGIDAIVASRPDWWVYADVTAVSIAIRATGGDLRPSKVIDEFRHLKHMRDVNGRS